MIIHQLTSGICPASRLLLMYATLLLLCTVSTTMPISHAVHISSLSSLHHSQHLLRRGQKHYHINNHNKVINDPHSNHTHTQKDANAKRVSHNIDAGSYDGGASLVEENAHVQTKTTMTMRGIHLDDEINTNFDADDDDDSLFDPSPSGNQEVDKENESAKGILTPWDENYDKETHYPNKLNSDNAWPAMPCKEWVPRISRPFLVRRTSLTGKKDKLFGRARLAQKCMEVFDCRDPPEYVYFAFYETKSLSQNVAGQECIPFAQVGFDKEVAMFQRTPNHIGDVTAYRPDNAGKRDAVMNKAFDVAYEIPLSSSKSQDAYVPVDIAFQTTTDIEDVEQIIHRLGVNTDLQNVATGHRRPSALNGAQALVSGHAELAQPLIECVDSDGGLVDLIEETDEGYDPAVHKLSSEDHFYYLVNRGRFTGKMQAMHTNFHENCMRIRKECANAVFLRFYSKDHCGDESKVTGEIIVREPALVEVVSFDLSNARTIEYDSPVRMPIGSTKGPAVLMEMAFLNEGELVSFMQGIGAYEQSKAYLAHSLLPVDLPQCGNEKSFDCKSRVNAAAASSHADRGISFQEAAKKQVSWEDEGSLFARATQSEEVDIGTRAFMDDVSFFSTLETHVGAVQEGNTVWLNFVLRELAQHFGNENAYRPKETDRHGNGYGHGYAYGDIDDRKPTARRRTDSYATDSSKGDASTKDEQDPISMSKPDSSIFTDKRLRLYPTCQFLDAAMRPGAQATRGMCDVFYAMRKYTEIFHRIGFKDAVVGTWHAIIAKATPDKRKQLEQREGNIVHLLKIMGKFNNEHAANDASAHGGAYICNRLKFGFDWFIQKSLDAKSGRTSVSEMTKLMIRLSTVSAALMDQVSIVEGMLAAGLTNAAVGMYSRKKNAKEEGQRAMLQVWINALDEVIQYPPSEANLSCRRTVNRLLKQMTSIIEYRKLKFAKDGSIAVPISYPRPAVIYYSKLMRESAENYHKYLRMVDNQFVDDVRDAIEWVIWYENAGSYYTENQWW